MTGGGAAWLLRRLLASVAIVFAVVTFVFILIHVAPGRPCAENIDPAVCDQLTRQFGLDKSIPEQYWRYLVALAHGNMGNSYANGRPVRSAIADAIIACLRQPCTAWSQQIDIRPAVESF